MAKFYYSLCWRADRIALPPKRFGINCMLSYRHAFHAGNHADVLKHLVLQQIVLHLVTKPKPFWVIDTHAGAGLYNLDSLQAQKGDEWQSGIGRLWGKRGLCPEIDRFLDAVQQVNTEGALRYYPGSPTVTAQLLRRDDKLRLFELHSAEYGVLEGCFEHSRGKQIMVQRSDGFDALKALLPPPTRRGLVLVDPAYETASDYRLVIKALADGLRRFSSGVYAIWYPMLAKSESQALPDQLKAIAGKNWLHIKLQVKPTVVNGFGMFGSGMFVVNPPWTLQKSLQRSLEILSPLLVDYDGAGFTLESQME